MISFLSLIVPLKNNSKFNEFAVYTLFLLLSVSKVCVYINSYSNILIYICIIYKYVCIIQIRFKPLQYKID